MTEWKSTPSESGYWIARLWIAGGPEDLELRDTRVYKRSDGEAPDVRSYCMGTIHVQIEGLPEGDWWLGPITDDDADLADLARAAKIPATA